MKNKLLVLFIGMMLFLPINVLAKINIDTITINNFTAPIVDNKVLIVSEDDERYDIEQNWLNADTNEILLEDSIFESGKNYIYKLTLIPTEEYSFSEDLIVEIENEKNDNWISSNLEIDENGNVVFTIQYTIKEKVIEEPIIENSTIENNIPIQIQKNNIKNGWIQENGNTYYYRNGVIQRGLQEIDGHYYFFGENTAKLFTNKVTALNGDIYIPDSDGKLYSRWIIENGNKYCTNEYGVIQKGLQKIGGNYYFFGENTAKLFTNKVTALNGDIYIPDSDGKLYSRWIIENGNKYYTNEYGVIQKGLQEIDGNYYFFGENTFKLFTTKVVALNGDIYIPDKEGRLYSRWIIESGNKYYTNEYGIMQKGITKLDGNKYFLGETTGKLWIGWVMSNDGNIYYTNDEGIIQMGDIIVDNKEYYFDEQGILYTGWRSNNDNEYYYIKGIIQKGITIIGQNAYFLGETTGKLWIGWVTALDGNKYYTNEDGIVMKGITIIGQNAYFLGETTGKLWIGWVTSNNGDIYYTNREGIILCGEQFIDNEWYVFSESGVLHNGWTTISNGNIYYVYANGTRAKGMKKIAGERYLFDSNGLLLKSNVKLWIDVSKWQGTIDWDKLWASGEIDGVILKIGSLGVVDSKFEYNISAVKRLGIPYTVYLFSYAENEWEASNEANYFISWFDKYQLNPSMNVYYDIESWTNSYDGHSSNTITVSDYDIIISTFITKLQSNGIGVKLYTGKNYAYERLSDNVRGYVDWIAHYTGSKNSDGSWSSIPNRVTDYSGNWRMWQYSDAGILPGISGYVDLNVVLY